MRTILAHPGNTRGNPELREGCRVYGTGASMYDRYSLVLMLTHACNLWCTYCYMGTKSHRVMPGEVGRKAIDRAVASLKPGGGLELGFFGGEPLLEPHLLASLIAHAYQMAGTKGITLRMGLTTNGTITTAAAWAILMREDMDVTISCDGRPEVHDRHRIRADGQGSWDAVTGTIRRLVHGGKEFRVISVVRPDTMEHLPDGLRYLRSLGVKHLEPSLDLWGKWSEEDETRLENVVAELADVWREGLPDHHIGWFDEKASHLMRLQVGPLTRCGFGDGAMAVAPSGRLYPCERLIGEDGPDNPMRLEGNAMDGEDFCSLRNTGRREHDSCGSCAMEGFCNTMCRCSNYARTGDPRRPDRLLCRWNQACLEQTARVLWELRPAGEGTMVQSERQTS